MTNISIINNEVIIELGVQGAQGAGVPAGGLEGQELIKSSDTSFDTEWKYVPEFNVLNFDSDFQAAHDAIFDICNEAESNNPANSVSIPANKYDFDAGLTWSPWIKMVSQGSVYLDFSELSTSGTAIRSSNINWDDASPGKNSSNTSPFINGAQGVFYIYGSGGTSIGLDLGNESSGTSAQQYRDVSVDNIVVSNFGTLLNLRNYDTYLLAIKNSRFETGGTQVVNITGTPNSNSGERISFDNCTIAGAPIGINITTQGYDINLINTSMDFCYNSAVQLNDGAGYNNISMTNCHLENSNNVALVKSNISDSTIGYTVNVNINNVKIVPSYNDPVPTGAYPSGSSPLLALFQGKMRLNINGLNISGYSHPSYNADTGLFMCDSDVRVISAENITFTGYRQVISEHRILNKNYNFNTGSAGTVLDYSSIAGWTFRNAVGISAELSTTQTYSSSTNSLKFTRTAGSNFYVMYSDPFDCTQGDKITFQNVVYGATSAGLLRVQNEFIQYQIGSTIPIAIASITVSGTTATVTTTSVHSLLPNHFINMSGASQSGYNGKKILTAASGSTFTYEVPAGTVSPATGAPVYIVEPLIPLSQGSALGDDFGSIYEITSYPGYTGNRLWWNKGGLLANGFDTTAPVPGVTHARNRVTVSQLSSGDVFYLGVSLMEKT